MFKPLTGSAIALAGILILAAPHDAGAGDFSAHWHDGNAELDGYRLQVRRYGQVREGQAVMIFVTEPFSESKRVKVDDAARNPEDTFDALKLNFVRDFSTGIYDYNTMVSVFSRTRDFAPAKVSFSSAEWCGHVYEEVRVDRDRIRGEIRSYFEGESGTIELSRPEDGVLEDNLFILLRGLREDFLEPGASRRVSLLPGSFYRRLTHQPSRWERAEISRGRDPVTVTVPAGSFTTSLYGIEIGDGRNGRFWIETEYPHRIVKWELEPDVIGELTGTLRAPYWGLNGNGDEEYLKELGLR